MSFKVYRGRRCARKMGRFGRKASLLTRFQAEPAEASIPCIWAKLLVTAAGEMTYWLGGEIIAAGRAQRKRAGDLTAVPCGARRG
jgi:hypothetical protein